MQYELLAAGKVRELYTVDADHLLLVASDRISAYDYVLDTTIPDKGRVLTAMSVFWFNWLAEQLDVPHHLVAHDDPRIPAELRGRALLVRKLTMLPVEAVARGYLAGSGIKEYRATGEVCGVPLPDGLVEASKLDSPIFTPATKSASTMRTWTSRRSRRPSGPSAPSRCATRRCRCTPRQPSTPRPAA